MRKRVAILMTLSAMLPPAVAMAQSRQGDSQPATLLAPTTRPVALNWSAPVTFARSGKKVGVAVMRGRPGVAAAKEVVLRAFGRSWTPPASVRAVANSDNDLADFDAPVVRVPTVFTIEPPDKPRIEYGQLVAYPDKDVDWDKKIALYSCGAPTWFDQWAIAIGLPVRKIDDVRKAIPPRGADETMLLIVGPGASGRSLPDAIGLHVNQLNLDATVFWPNLGAQIKPIDLTGGLSDLAGQRWARPLGFMDIASPVSAVANRWPWIFRKVNTSPPSGEILVEQLWQACEQPEVGPLLQNRVIASYVFGRNDSNLVIPMERSD